jgi:hypothetical protein
MGLSVEVQNKAGRSMPDTCAATEVASGVTAASGAYPRRNLPSSIASALAMLLGLIQAKKSINLQLGLPSL